MIRYGFIRTKEEIKFLILNCMTYLPFPVNFDALVDICTWCDDGFGYFEMSEAFQELLGSGHILSDKTQNDFLYSITDKGIETARLFEKSLPYTVREAAETSAMRVVRKLQRDAQVTCRTEKRGEKDFIVHMEMEDVFSISMNAVSHSQAAMLERNFKKNAEKIYNQVLTALTRDYEENEKS